MGLSEYWKKRNFEKTPEPSGKKKAGRRAVSRLSFCIQKHAATRLHYDFRLEMDGVLKSWAVPKGPSLDPKARRLAVHVEDHPLSYGSFEGNIPAGQYGGGAVLLWDRGTWTPEDDPAEMRRKGRIRFKLHGKKLHGAWLLIRMHGREENGRENWLLIKDADEEARRGREGDITASRPESVTSGRTIDDIAERARKVWQSDRAGEDTQFAKRIRAAMAAAARSKARTKAAKRSGTSGKRTIARRAPARRHVESRRKAA